VLSPQKQKETKSAEKIKGGDFILK